MDERIRRGEGEERADHLLVFPVNEVVGCLVDKGHFGSLRGLGNMNRYRIRTRNGNGN